MADPEIVARWASVGSSIRLSAGADIASFLLNLYSEGRQPQSETTCVHCNEPLVLSCLVCQSSSQAPPIKHLRLSPALSPSGVTVNSDLPHSAVPLCGTSSKTSPEAVTSSTTVCISDPASSVSHNSSGDSVTQLPDPSHGSEGRGQEEEEGTLQCDGFDEHFEDSERETGGCLGEADGEESDPDWCPQEMLPEMSSAPEAGGDQAERDQESPALAAEAEGGKEMSQLLSSQGEGQESSSHTDTEMYVCPDCSETLPSAQLRKHVKNHYKAIRKKGAYSCRACSKTFPYLYRLYNHTLLRLSDQKCEECDEVLVSGCQVKEHRKQHDRFCACCDTTFPGMTKKEFDRHKLKHENKTNQSLLCPHCGMAFTSTGRLNIHMKIHSKERPFVCRTCNKAFKRKTNLQQHEVFHRDKTRQCETCGAKFYTKGQLQKHAQKHTGRLHPCKYCPRRFPSSDQLKNHEADVHKKVFRFFCTQCEMKFCRAGGLKQHMRTHTGEKPYSCEQCSARFRARKGLEKHMMRHEGKKPFSCEDCEQTYSSSSSLKAHRQKNHGESLYLCSDCPEVFFIRSSLNFHRRLCHNEDFVRETQLASQYILEIKPESISAEEKEALTSLD